MNFKAFFSITEKDIKQNCIICQSFDLSLFANEFLNGFFIKSAAARNATIISLRNNFLAGDTILHLKNIRCENIFLFGSCGGCGNIEHGDLVMIDKAYNLESFSHMLNFDQNAKFYQSSKDLMLNFYKKNIYDDLIKTNSACAASLVL